MEIMAYVFETEEAAQAAIDKIDQGFLAVATRHGYEVIDGEVVPRRASDGTPNREAARASTWAIPFELTDGKFMVPSVRTIAPTEYPAIEALIENYSYEDVEARLPEPEAP